MVDPSPSNHLLLPLLPVPSSQDEEDSAVDSEEAHCRAADLFVATLLVGEEAVATLGQGVVSEVHRFPGEVGVSHRVEDFSKVRQEVWEVEIEDTDRLVVGMVGEVSMAAVVVGASSESRDRV